MDLRPKEGVKMRSVQHIETKEHKSTTDHDNNMNNSRSERGYTKSEPDFDYYVAKKYNSKSDKERELYFQKLLEAFRTLSEEAPEVFHRTRNAAAKHLVLEGRRPASLEEIQQLVDG